MNRSRLFPLPFQPQPLDTFGEYDGDVPLITLPLVGWKYRGLEQHPTRTHRDYLEFEPDNRYDPNAIKYMVQVDGKHIHAGYVCKDHAALVAKVLSHHPKKLFRGGKKRLAATKSKWLRKYPLLISCKLGDGPMTMALYGVDMKTGRGLRDRTPLGSVGIGE